MKLGGIGTGNLGILAAGFGTPVAYPPPIVTHISAVVATDPVSAREAARPTLERFARNAQYAAMFAGRPDTMIASFYIVS